MPLPSSPPLTKPFSVEHIVAVRNWTPSLRSFTTTRPPELNYVPGQYARLGLPCKGQGIWRAFSFVSAPDEPLLEFLAVLIPDGLFTSELRELQAGDPIHIEHENYGFLTADRFVDGDVLWMLATGTGIGPFVSMLRDAAIWQQFPRIVLVHGVRHGAELTYREELLRLQSQHPPGALSLLACLSHPGPHELAHGRISGRITSAWDSGALEAAVGMPVTAENSRVMLCGNPQMIEDMRHRLHGRKMMPCRRAKPGQFLTENYW